MMRSLMWKEWREQRPIAWVGVGVAGGMPLLIAGSLVASGYGDRLGEIVNLLPIANWFLLIPLATLATGASVFSQELRDARLAFLLSRPVPRGRVLTAKLLVAGAITALVVAAGQATAGLASWLLPAPAIGRDARGSTPLELTDFDPVVLIGLLVLGLLWFALAAYLSLALERTLAIAVVAGIVGTCAYLVHMLVWWRIDFYPYRLFWLAGGLVVVTALGLIAAAYRLLATGELLRGPRHLGRAAALGLAVVAMVGLVELGLLTWVARPPAGEILLADLSGSPSEGVVLTVARTDGMGRRAALVAPDGGLEAIGSRLTEGAALSPDGSRLAYWKLTGRLGLVDGRAALMVRDRRSGVERAVSPRRHGPGHRTAFSRNGRYVAADQDRKLILADASGARPAREIVAPRGASCYLTGWDDLRGQALRQCNRRSGRSLEWIDPENGLVAQRVELGDVSISTPRAEGSRIRTLIIEQDPLGTPSTTLLDLATMQQFPLGIDTHERVEGIEDLARGWSRFRDRIVYAFRRLGPRRRFDSVLEIRLLDLATGNDVLLETLPGSHARVALSADGARGSVLAGVLEENARLFHFTLEPEVRFTERAGDIDWGWGREVVLGPDLLVHLSSPGRGEGDSIGDHWADSRWRRGLQSIDLNTGATRTLVAPPGDDD